MDNEQLNSNLNQLIINQDEIVKNQIEICEVIKDLTKQVKKIRKPKNQPYFLGDFITDDLDHILKIMQTNLGLVYMYELSKEGIISYCNDDRTFYDQLIKVIGRKNKYGIK